MDLTEFVRAQLDKDEQTARAATRAERGEPERPWVFDPTTETVGPRDSCGRDDCAWSILDVRDTDDNGDKLPTASNGQHIARHDPARVLRGVEAKRRAVDEYAYWVDRALNPGPYPQPDQGGRFETAATMVKALAAEWSDHPDYREEWRP